MFVLNITRKQKKVIAVIAVLSLVSGGVVVAQILGLMSGSFDFSSYEMPCQFVYAADSAEVNLVISPDGLSMSGVIPKLEGVEVTISEFAAIELFAGFSPAIITFNPTSIVGLDGTGLSRQYYINFYAVNSTHDIQVMWWRNDETNGGNPRKSAPVDYVLCELTYLKVVIWIGGVLGNPVLNTLTFDISVPLQPAPI